MEVQQSRIKEATFIQTGRRGRDAEMGRDAVWRREMVAAEQAVPHSCVVGKNQEGYLESQ